MTPPQHDPRRAWRQALQLLAALGCIGLVAAASSARPDGPVELKIAAAQLRSQAAELKWLDEGTGHALPPRFVRAHARQLTRDIEHAAHELEHLRPAPPDQPVQQALQPQAQALLAEARALQHARGPQPPASAAQLQARADTLAAAELALVR